MSSVHAKPSTDHGPAPLHPWLHRAVDVLRQVDRWMLGAALALAGFGVVMVVSASSHYSMKLYGHILGFGLRQVAGLGLGALVGLAVLFVPWTWIRRVPVPAFVFSLVLLALVQSPLGHAAKGAPRWIKLGPVNLQPSELVKITLAMALAHHLAKNVGHIRETVSVVGSAVVTYVLPVLFLIFLQRDLGTMGLVMGIAVVAFFVAGLDLKWLLGTLIAALAAVVVLIVSEPYRARRVMSFLDPHADAQDGGYQVVQGWVALAVGGVPGTGLGSGVAQQGFLPEAHTDMILAVVGEELGILGWSAVFLLHGILLWRGTEIAARARTLFEMVTASCITAVLAAQAAINSAVVAGLFPPKGLVLPFMSYGASAVLFHTLAIAVLLRIGIERSRPLPGG